MYLLGDPNTINLRKLELSVGEGGKNLPLDVLVIQRLINGTRRDYGGKTALKTDGLYGPNTVKQVIAFQKAIVGYKNPDGRVDVNGRTHNKLLTTLSADYVRMQKTASLRNQKKMINLNRFSFLYKKQFSNAKNISHMERLLLSILMDGKVTDMRWVAYMLATVRWECAGTWQPIEEYGKGKGMPYDEKYDVIDPETNKTRTNLYYGRGYVQLTWERNYRQLGKELGMGERLYIKPELALEHDIAYRIMSIGMRKGLFSGRRLAQYIGGTNTDYVGARTIINGNDHASDIAKLAAAYEEMLKASVFAFDYMRTAATQTAYA